MPRPDGPQFKDIHFSVRPPSKNYSGWTIHALSSDSGTGGRFHGFALPTYPTTVGSMGIDPQTGTVDEVAVHEPFQRKGVATEMLKTAKNMHEKMPNRFPRPQHSAWRTHAGDEWAKSTGDPVPPNEYE